MVIRVHVSMYGLFVLRKHHVCGLFLVQLCSHTKLIAIQEKSTQIYGKSSHKTPFGGSGHTDAVTQNRIDILEKDTRTKVATGHRFVDPSIRPSEAWNTLFIPPPNEVYWIHLVRLSVCLSVDDMVSGA